jgi:hypothetical protein
MGIKNRLVRFLVGDVYQQKVQPLSNLHEKLYNEGERLIPGVTHDMLEVIRHKSSYEFFRTIIDDDIAIDEKLRSQRKVTISDFGFGVGHGCYLLSRVRNSDITGLDISTECRAYAQEHYPSHNIKYENVDLAEFAKTMPSFDYVVSRGVFEHIPDGLNVAYSTKWKKRLIFDVPYNELAGPNEHHVITGIVEKDFDKFVGAELFYQDLDGVIYDAEHKPEKPNMIICVCSHKSLPSVKSKNIKFPYPVWRL